MGPDRKKANHNTGIFLLILNCLFATYLSSAQGTPGSAAASRWGIHGEVPAAMIQQVGIFGDGNPFNGVEDNRIDMSSPRWNDPKYRSWNRSAGTIHCDGSNRGSATIIDTREFGELSSGFIIATSAHVLFDLKKNQRFTACQFHYMAVDHPAEFQSVIDLDRSILGEFDPASSRSSVSFGKGDWAFLLVREAIPGAGSKSGLSLLPFKETMRQKTARIEFQFIAYNPVTDSMAISNDCQLIESRSDDLGGGVWPGQLLDDCDSGGGASGGGLIASVGDMHFLVGIRSGTHWDSRFFPKTQFPSGPPDGAAWDILANTNFSRAIDNELVEAVRALVRDNSIRKRIDTDL